MKLLLASTALAFALAAAPAMAQPPTPAAEEFVPAPQAPIEGGVTVQGIEAAKVLGAIDPTELTDKPAIETAAVEPPAPRSEITIDTEVVETASAKVETRTEVITPVSAEAPANLENPIAAQVQAVVDAKPNYTTADLANAQLAAVLAMPASLPTTTITTTSTTPKTDG